MGRGRQAEGRIHRDRITDAAEDAEQRNHLQRRQAHARQAYNDSVMGYNNAREVFPSSIVANMFAFQAAQLLEIDAPEKREAVKVSFT